MACPCMHAGAGAGAGRRARNSLFVLVVMQMQQLAGRTRNLQGAVTARAVTATRPHAFYPCSGNRRSIQHQPQLACDAWLMKIRSVTGCCKWVPTSAQYQRVTQVRALHHAAHARVQEHACTRQSTPVMMDYSTQADMHNFTQTWKTYHSVA